MVLAGLAQALHLNRLLLRNKSCGLYLLFNGLILRLMVQFMHMATATANQEQMRYLCVRLVADHIAADAAH